LAGLDLKAATYLGRNLVRTLKEWFPDKKVYAAVFPDEEFVVSFDPLSDGPKLALNIDCDGILIDTYNKSSGMGLLDYYSTEQLTEFASNLHEITKEAWLAGSIARSELPALWTTGVDVICVRGAACEPHEGLLRFGTVRCEIVQNLVETLQVKS
jgi:uncharacterized protein (UPF0264 family)